MLLLDELVLWLSQHLSNVEFVNQKGRKLAKFVESADAHRPIPLVSFVDPATGIALGATLPTVALPVSDGVAGPVDNPAPTAAEEGLCHPVALAPPTVGAGRRRRPPRQDGLDVGQRGWRAPATVCSACPGARATGCTSPIPEPERPRRRRSNRNPGRPLARRDHFGHLGRGTGLVRRPPSPQQPTCCCHSAAHRCRCFTPADGRVACPGQSASGGPARALPAA